MMTVADFIANFLVKKNVEHIFGFQGSAMLKMLDAIMATGKIKYIQNFNEQASAFCADAYARVKGNIGIAIATSGPGATNLITGIADAFCDSIPTLFITGQERLSVIRTRGKARQNGFQDIDIVSMVKPITKYAVLLDNPDDVQYELEKAFYIATAGRKGPVLIDVPIDIQFETVDETKLKHFSEVVNYKNDLSSFPAIVSAINCAKKPVILVGGGVRQAGAENLLNEFYNKTKIPVVATLNGLDACADMVGFAGLYGNTAANMALLNADLLLVLGSRLALQHIGKKKENYNKNAKIIHVDIDETEFNRTFLKENIIVSCDLKCFLQKLVSVSFDANYSSWLQQITSWQNIYTKDNLYLKGLIKNIVEKADEEAVVTVDVGENQMWVAQSFSTNGKQRLLSSSGFGAMGFSLPAAVGASFATKQVISFMGDGGFQMNLQELNTLSLLQRNVKCFIFNNGCLGLMRSIQKKFYNSHFYGNTSKEFSCPDIAMLAKTYRINYFSIADDSDFHKLNEIFSDNRPCLVDIKIDISTAVLNRYDDKALQNG